MLYFEDLYPGLRYSSGTHALDETQIKTFAQQFDPQPFHLDDVLARDTLFGGLAASGWHTAAISMKLVVTGQVQLAGGMIGAGIEVNWPTPTRPDDVLQVESEIREVRLSKSRPDLGMVTIHSETRNQRGEVRMTQVAKVLVFRRK